jgi:DNA-binding GntR family transcriptional regulator
MILRRCIEALTLAKLKRLEALVADHRKAVEADDIEGTLQTARSFHTALFEMGGNHEAERLFQRGWDTILALRLRFGYSKERLDNMEAEFRELINALRRRSACDAEAVIRMHNRAGMEDLLRKIDRAKLSSRVD